MRISSIGYATLFAAAAAFAAVQAQGAEQHRGRSIEFSEPRSSESMTNLDQLTFKKNGLKQLEEDLYKPFQTFSPKSSMEGFLDPPQARRAPAPMPNKKQKERLDRQRNWIFVDPDDESSGPTAEEIFNIPEYDADGQPKKKLSVFEQYVQNQERKQKGKGKDDKGNGWRSGTDFAGAGNDSDSRDDSDSWGDKKEGASDRDRGLKKPSGSDNGGGFAPTQRGTFTDIFGLGDRTVSPEDAAKHKAYLDEFRALLSPGGKAPGDSFGLPGAVPDSSKSSLSAVGSWDNFPGSAQRENLNSFSGTKSAFGSTPSPNSAYGFNSRNFSSPAPAPAPATVNPTPKAPTFAAPRRSF